MWSNINSKPALSFVGGNSSPDANAADWIAMSAIDSDSIINPSS